MDGDLVKAVGILMVASLHVAWSQVIDKTRLMSLLSDWTMSERRIFGRP